MEPLNKAERKKAFTNYLLFFLLTVALVVATVLFSIQVPFSQNRQLTKQMKAVEAERDFVQRFQRNMYDVMRLFDSSKNPGVNVTLIDGKIEGKIRAMSTMIDSDSTTESSSSAVKDLYNNVVSTLGEYLAAKRELRDATNKDANLSQLSQKVQSLENQISTKDQIIALKDMQIKQLASSN